MRNSSQSSDVPHQPSRSGPQSVGRIFAVLDALAENGQGATLSELAANAGAPKTSLVGLLTGLQDEGCLTRDDAGRYQLGPRFISLAMRAVAGRDLSMLAHPVLAELVTETGETAVLGVLATDADLVQYLDKVESDNPIRYAVTVGERRDLYCTAAGKLLLAYFPAERLDSYLKTTRRQRFTPSTVTKISVLRAELAQIRKDGIARTSDERIEGAAGLAAPVFDPNGDVIATMLIAGPSERMRSNLKSNEIHLKRAAAECTRLIGGVAAV